MNNYILLGITLLSYILMFFIVSYLVFYLFIISVLVTLIMKIADYFKKYKRSQSEDIKSFLYINLFILFIGSFMLYVCPR